MIKAAGYDVKYIQQYLHLSCPQSIYRWFKGKILPSVEHLSALSILLGVHMEKLNNYTLERLLCYRKFVINGHSEIVQGDFSLMNKSKRTMNTNAFERREAILKLRTKVLQAEQERIDGEETLSVSQARERLRERI